MWFIQLKTPSKLGPENAKLDPNLTFSAKSIENSKKLNTESAKKKPGPNSLRKFCECVLKNARLEFLF